ncbi:phenylalanine--tRNA ligase subunit beta [Cytophagales bacterium LB-30]|uniref:Phenylalanine--tRNA ligase beta subunit n=1 Tax=Shiella aurantiaca TaxID=3058365 RepID=A0ABT8F324_9BACT|nr:phenylalanine--tRNA ligase subunit beta [Shiella aurantiaca]MDN4164850.1 phenylalanine--tRNA ligase subunit beta [Shiella aurantiaca]
MKISLNWLKEFIHTDLTANEIAALLTQSGLEVESVEAYEQVPGGFKGLVIGEVMTCEKHPDADKLSKTTVDIGNEVVPIVCGAPNVAAGQKVIVATVGTTLYPTSGEPFVIKKAKIRGAESVGMICAEDEIGIGTSHAGIMVLDTILPNGTPIAEYFDVKEDHVLEIGLTPNRADAAGHWGVARDLRALLKTSLTLPDISKFKVDNTALPIQVKVENAEACPRYSGLSISGITVTDSPAWLKTRLSSIGVRPINNVVDITNYVLHELGQPLHAFDADKIKGQTVLVKTLAQGTPFVTLDEKERKLNASDLMICDAQGPMCIAGVFGGISSGVTANTKNIFLESAYFSADSIRKTAQSHGLKTDASFRFERGTDPNATLLALKRAALLIQEIAGGSISSEVVDIYPAPVEDAQISVRFKNIHRLIGKVLPHQEIESILQHLDIQLINITEEGFTAIVPPYRVDVQREADIIEEILRIYGFDRIELKESLSTDFVASFESKDKHKLQFRISEILAGNGFQEIMTNSLTKPAYSELTSDFDTSTRVDILNRLSEDLGAMRQSLLFSGLEVLAHNLNHKQSDLKLFEFGTIYNRKEKGFKEERYLSLFMTGAQMAESWQHKEQNVSYYDLQAAVLKVIHKLNPSGLVQVSSTKQVFEFGLDLNKGDKTVASLGKLSKKVLKSFDIRQEVYYAEIAWDLLRKYSQSQVAYTEVSKFPEVRRDISLVLDKSVSFANIQKIASKMESRLLRQVNVFDVYEGENLGQNKKAYAISFTLQDAEKTLTDKVIDKTMEKLMGAFESELGAIIRK